MTHTALLFRRDFWNQFTGDKLDVGKKPSFELAYKFIQKSKLLYTEAAIMLKAHYWNNL